MTVSAAMLDHLAGNVTTLAPIWKMIAQDGVKQVETATVAGTVTGTGNATVTVTAAGMPGSPKAVSVPVISADTASIVAGKIRIALAADSSVGGFFDISGAGTSVVLTDKIQDANDATLNVAIANGTCTGLTAAPTSTNTTAGVLGTVAAYAAHTRPLTFGSVAYSAAQVEPTRFTETLGVQQANHIELFGIFDSIVTEADMQSGRWKNARITFEYVNYLDLTMLSVKKMKGQAGKFSINNGTFTVELRSLSDLLHQDIGDLTCSLDRNRRPEELGVAMAAFTFARTVAAVADRRNFTVGGAAQVNDYFKYGRAEFVTGGNAGLKMEIKASVGNAIELQLPMRATIVIGDTLNLIAGYDSTREQARDKFAAMENFDGEPDLPGLKAIISYPE